MRAAFKSLSPKERNFFERLNTPGKLQDFLNKLPYNFETSGETCMSPRRVILGNRAHCIEGALFAAAVLWYHGKSPLVMHLKTKGRDFDHVVAVFKEGGRWGAISKTNHAVLRYRDPVYMTPRELAMSYFNEYFMDDNGKKTMVGFTSPVDLEKSLGTGWLTSPKDLWEINDYLYHAKHHAIAPQKIMRKLRPADKIERKVMDVPEQKEPRRKKNARKRTTVIE